MAVDFVFNRPVTPTPGPVDFVFGDGGSTPTVIDATLHAALLPAFLPALSVAASAQQEYRATVAGTLPEVGLQTLGVIATAEYESELHSSVSIPCRAPHVTAATRAAGLVVPTQTAADRVRPLRADHDAAAPRTTGLRACLQQLPQRHRSAHLPIYQRAGVVQGLRLGQYQRPTVRRPLRIATHHTQQMDKGLALGQFDLARVLRPLQILRTESALVTTGIVIRIRGGRFITIRRCLPIYGLQWPVPGRSPRPVPPPGPGDGSLVRLVFVRPQDSTNDLIFNYQPTGPQPGGTIIIPVREVYLVQNTVTLIRASDGAPLAADVLDLSIDANSWTWSWSASIPANQIELVRPSASSGPVEVIASINGQQIHLLVEQIARERRFATASLRISGRGLAALLTDPHSPVATRYNDTARTAAQLLDDALTDNGVPIGWLVDWQTTDWLVPAGAWSHTGTYIEAATRLAEAGGAYVQADDTAQTLHVMPWYPVKPWEWADTDPDIELPDAVCEVESIEWMDKPAYNAVYVVGGEGGRADRIKRAGSAADRYAPTVVDQLATATEMTLVRGTQILADTGRQAHVSVRLPVLAETGIIHPGQLIRYVEQGGTEHLGISRAVSISRRFPDLWQTIKLETHAQETA